METTHKSGGNFFLTNTAALNSNFSVSNTVVRNIFLIDSCIFIAFK